MKIMTLNVHAWEEDQPLEKLASLAQHINDQDYDYILLQEVNQLLADPVVKPTRFIRPSHEEVDIPIKQSNYAYQLLKLLDYPYYWSWTPAHVGYGKYDEGLAILAKSSFAARCQRISTNQDYQDYRRRVVLAVHLSEKDLELVSGHYSWWQSVDDEYPGQSFQAEWDQTRKILTSGGRKIVGGDFNQLAHVNDQGYDYVLATSDLLDAYRMATSPQGQATVPGEIEGWEGDDAAKRIDYFFVSPNLNVQSYQTLFDGQAMPQVSDHFGIALTLTRSTSF